MAFDELALILQTFVHILTLDPAAEGLEMNPDDFCFDRTRGKAIVMGIWTKDEEFSFL